MASITQGANGSPKRLWEWEGCSCVRLGERNKARKKQDWWGGAGFRDEKSSPVQMHILWRPHTPASVPLHSSLSASPPLIKWPRSGDNLISLRGPDT